MSKYLSANVHSITRVTLFQVVALFTILYITGCSKHHTAGLQTADVPVALLVHSETNAARAYPETFPMQVAVYLTAPNQSILGLIHALREMGIPFFVTTDFKRALRIPCLSFIPLRMAQRSRPRKFKRSRNMSPAGKVFSRSIFSPAVFAGFSVFAVTPRRSAATL